MVVVAVVVAAVVVVVAAVVVVVVVVVAAVVVVEHDRTDHHPELAHFHRILSAASATVGAWVAATFAEKFVLGFPVLDPDQEDRCMHVNLFPHHRALPDDSYDLQRLCSCSLSLAVMPNKAWAQR